MSQQLVANTLDRAITAVAKDEFKRLRNGLSRLEVAQKVEYALEELRKLSRGVMPDYDDEWVALFYITWYQPSQINLAYSIIKKMMSEGVSLNDKLHVVDFGCGALALQFGVALAVADEIEQGQLITEIRIVSIDTSQPMVNIGKKVWVQFCREARNDPNLHLLARACEVMKFQTTDNLAFVKRQVSAQACWLSALHAVYDSNKVLVKQIFNYLANTTSPDVCFTTTHSYKANLLAEIWSSSNYSNECMENVQPQFSGNLSLVIQWRTSLCEKLLQRPIEDGIDDSLIRNYLSNPRFPVTWKWRDAAILIHTRRR